MCPPSTPSADQHEAASDPGSRPAFDKLPQPDGIGREIHDLIGELFPIPRSITGDGVRETLHRIGQRIPLTLHEVPTGTKVLDWTIPKEWNIRGATLKTADGETVVDFADCNLHIVFSSAPVKLTLPLSELRPRLYSLPEHPDWIPYRYSHYGNNWGFCLSHRQLEALPEGDYRVEIDTTLEDGSLTYGECLIEGRRPEEILISCHVCHPSLANDNLSGVAVATALATQLRGLDLTYSYRFIFVPSLIGAITWLARNEANVGRIRAGLVLSCLGDPGVSTYKRSRRGDREIDRAVLHVLGQSGAPFDVRDFSPYGYDERQFNSPGFDLPVGLLMRTPYERFPEYHTSADNLDFVQPDALADSFQKCLSVFHVLDNNRVLVNQSPKGEPQLGRRGLYRAVSGQTDEKLEELPMLWVLNLSDGTNSLLDIAERSGIAFAQIKRAADALAGVGLLEDAGEAP
jgi:aminopeptidase-like protein